MAVAGSGRLLVLAVLCMTYIGKSQVAGGYLALMPQKSTPGSVFNVVLTVSDDMLIPVTVTGTLRSGTDEILSASSSVRMEAGETKVLGIQMPQEIREGIRYKIHIFGKGGVTFNDEVWVNLDSESSMVLVQTDKAIYKPGQTVRFRVLHLDKMLKPVTSSLIITIINAKGSKIEQFLNADASSGVIEKKFELSQYPSLGDWKILVEDGEKQGVTLAMTNFTVEEFVLPKFSVTVQGDPDFLISGNYENKPSPAIIVTSNYTFGKGVQGRCQLIIKSLNSVLYSSSELADSGVAEFTKIDWSSLRIKPSTDVVVQATVTDETGRKQTEETTLRVYENEVQIQILDTSTELVRADIPAHLFVRVSDHSGQPVDSGEIEVVLTLRGREELKTRLTVPKGQTDIHFKYTVKLPEYEGLHSAIGSLEVKLVDKGIKTSKTIYVYLALKSKGIVIRAPMTDFRVDEPAEFGIETSNQESAKGISSYVVLGQGTIVDAGVIHNDQFVITPTPSMCPHAKVLVYLLISDEVVTDVFEFTPTGCFRKMVKVDFDVEESRTGSDVNMKVAVDRTDGSNALPGVHNVFYLAVDKSIVLLQGSTDVNEQKVLSGMSKFDLESLRREQTQPTYTASAMFKSTGLHTVTDVKIRDQIEVLPEFAMVESDAMAAGGASNIRPMENDADDDTLKKEDEKGSESVSPSTKTVRKDFPDTWLWDSAVTGINGKLKKTVRVPDTITSWVVSAFAINQEGLAVAEKPFELRAFQTFFLSLNLPYSIRRGEIFDLRVTVFNYRKQGVAVSVKLEITPQFLVMDGEKKDGWVEKKLEIGVNLASSVEFKINASEVGLMDLRVKAVDKSDQSSDEIIRRLIVRPEGEKRSHALTRILMLASEAGSVSHSFNIPWPVEKIVPDSRRVAVKVSGDVFGQALSGLESLVRMPIGCGEQNMITTVPNIFGLKYIRTLFLTGMEDLEKKLLKNMKYGYQRQIDNYRHSDGSFSAWGQRSSSGRHEGSGQGSTWLTAFVVKSFAQASQYIHVESSVLSTGVNFLRSKQTIEGKFKENGKVFHKEMQTGTGTGPGLTLYTLISLLEAQKVLGDKIPMTYELKRAQRYMKTTISSASFLGNKNLFLASLSLYALSLFPERDSQTMALVNTVIEAIDEMGAPWMESQELNSDSETELKRKTHASHNAQALESAAYILLAHLELDQLSTAIPLMKWLEEQQNSDGGFKSTQDTVLVLQALSRFGEVFTNKDMTASVGITSPNTNIASTIDISWPRSVLLQTEELPSDVDIVNVALEGSPNSFTVVKVVYEYYTLPGEDALTVRTEPALSVFTRTTKLSRSTHKVEACVKSTNAIKDSKMFVTTMTLPSGEDAVDDIPTLMQKNPRVSRIETNDDEIHFYLDTAPASGYCLQADVERQMEFDVQLPGSAKVYSYYEPDILAEVPLELSQSDGTFCSSDDCGMPGGAVSFNLAGLLLTIIICSVISLLTCL